ncbi:MAG: FAD:protein FMN transferase [Lactobacillus sp.]|nr:FAD:protein FMN transferase [Lactobacillus sp.]
MEAETITHRALGTKNVLTVFGGVDVLKKSCDLIDHYEDLLTVNRDQSEVMDINKAAGKHPVSVSSPVYQLAKTAILESRKNYGFNALIGPVVKLWHIGFSDARKPSEVEIKAKLAITNPEDATFDDDSQSIFLTKKGMELDLGGIGKGYIADRIKDLWQAYGVSSGIINLGGNLLFVGKNPKQADGLWRIGVQDPKKARDVDLAIVTMPECSAVTSGVYERYLKIGNETFHHIIDPRTGYPLKTDLAGVTVFTKTSIEAELLDKKLFFNGPVASSEKLGAVFVYQDGTVKYDQIK